MDRSNLEKIETAVSQLSPEDLAKFRTWFTEFDAANWDRQFEEDVAARLLYSLVLARYTHRI